MGCLPAAVRRHRACPHSHLVILAIRALSLCKYSCLNPPSGIWVSLNSFPFTALWPASLLSFCNCCKPVSSRSGYFLHFWVLWDVQASDYPPRILSSHKHFMMPIVSYQCISFGIESVSLTVSKNLMIVGTLFQAHIVTCGTAWWL